MALLGPMVVVAENPAAEAVEMLGKAGAFPIIEASWDEAGAAIDEIKPCAVLLADPGPAPDHAVEALRGRIEAAAPVMPVLARLGPEGTAQLPQALAVSALDPMPRLIDRLGAALRIRALHAAVLRRSTESATDPVFALPPQDGLDHATVICVGRGGSYPALAVAIGERVGLIGALSIETAMRYLKSRDIDGLVIGDGFGPRVVEGLLAALAEDGRFRDLPIGILGSRGANEDRLPNLVRVEDNAQRLIERLLPFVRLRAFEGRLRRLLKSLESGRGS
jgi:hypothetical protein